MRLQFGQCGVMMALLVVEMLKATLLTKLLSFKVSVHNNAISECP